MGFLMILYVSERPSKELSNRCSNIKNFRKLTMIFACDSKLSFQYMSYFTSPDLYLISIPNLCQLQQTSYNFAKKKLTCCLKILRNWSSYYWFANLENSLQGLIRTTKKFILASTYKTSYK